jgi:hypothetical protein
VSKKVADVLPSSGAPIDSAAMRLDAWYTGFTCKGCQKKFAMAEDWTGGMRPQRIPAVKDARVLLVVCPYCHDEHEYPAADKVTFCNRAPPKGRGRSVRRD